jgi:predicted DNA-binding ribbon-helix-helix protein
MSVEDTFWECLRRIAKDRGQTLGQLVASIDEDRQRANLSSAFVLGFYQRQPDPDGGTRLAA